MGGTPLTSFISWRVCSREVVAWVDSKTGFGPEPWLPHQPYERGDSQPEVFFSRLLSASTVSPSHLAEEPPELMPSIFGRLSDTDVSLAEIDDDTGEPDTEGVPLALDELDT